MSVAPPLGQDPSLASHPSLRKEKRGSVLGRFARKLSFMRCSFDGYGRSQRQEDDWHHVSAADAKSGLNAPEPQYLDTNQTQERASVKRVPPPTMDDISPQQSKREGDSASSISVEAPFSIGELTIANPDILPTSESPTPSAPIAPLPPDKPSHEPLNPLLPPPKSVQIPSPPPIPAPPTPAKDDLVESSPNSWEMERLWKARSMYGTEANDVVAPAGGTTQINGSSSTVGVDPHAHAHIAMSMGVNLGPSTVNGLHGSSHTTFVVQNSLAQQHYPHPHLHQHPQRHQGGGIYAMYPPPMAPAYGAYHGPYGGSSPGLLGHTGVSAGKGIGVGVSPTPGAGAGGRDTGRDKLDKELPPLADPLPDPPRESTFEASKLSSDFWTKYSELTLVHSTLHTARSSGDQRTVTQNRKRVAEEMDSEMLICSLEDFQTSYLPFVPSPDDVKRVTSKVKSVGWFSKNDQGTYEWPDLKQSDSKTEPEIHTFLLGIAEVIRQQKFKDSGSNPNRVSKPQVIYHDCPNQNIFSRILGADFRIDGCFKLNDKADLVLGKSGIDDSKTLVASNLAVIAEYKKSSSDYVDNRQKLVSAVNYVMNEDPRRIFMFGITIEKTTMSLWYFSRSHSTKSTEFDFAKEPEKLVSVFISLMFSSMTALGYDEAIRRSYQPGERIHYEYRIIDSQKRLRYFRTRESLSTYRSLVITGRMTRVWRAVEIDSFGGKEITGEAVALKDVWLDELADIESTIQDKIFTAIQEEKDKDVAGESSRIRLIQGLPIAQKLTTLIQTGAYKQYFVNILCDQQSQSATSKAKPENAIPVKGLFSSSTSDPIARSHLEAGADTSRHTSNPALFASNPTSSLNQHINDRTYNPKKRYLVVYSDVGKALHNINTLSELFKVLEDIVFALAILFIANWVHRDISSGNIIVMGNGQSIRGKLSDLEYARGFNSQLPLAKDPKTGTAFFMAYEILTGSKVLPELGDFTRPLDLEEVKTYKREPEQNIIIYNFSHDLESLWWIVLWFLLACIDHEPSRLLADTIFQDNIFNPPSQRARIFLHPSLLKVALDQNLHEQLKVFSPKISNAALLLLHGYGHRHYMNKVLDTTSYTSLYTAMWLLVTGCKDICDNQTTLPALITHQPEGSMQSSLPPSNPLSVHGSAPVRAGPASKRGVPPHHDDSDDGEPKGPLSKRLKTHQPPSVELAEHSMIPTGKQF
ncbi:Cyclin-dependent kinase 8 [Leucoagaricus sp. SymC.cos]|nr:Cyclin-dependent kinase 8 [Leucoagaricus sp. SymC.cos]